MRQFTKAGLAATLFALSAAALAQNASPVGAWKTIDDETGKPKALVRITEDAGILTGKIEKLYRPAERRHQVTPEDVRNAP